MLLPAPFFGGRGGFIDLGGKGGVDSILYRGRGGGGSSYREQAFGGKGGIMLGGSGF